MPRRAKREGTVGALRDTGMRATSPAAREDRDGSSPLQDAMRYAPRGVDQGGTAEQTCSAPDTVGGGALFYM